MIHCITLTKVYELQLAVHTQDALHAVFGVYILLSWSDLEGIGLPKSVAG